MPESKEQEKKQESQQGESEKKEGSNGEGKNNKSKSFWRWLFEKLEEKFSFFSLLKLLAFLLFSFILIKWFNFFDKNWFTIEVKSFHDSIYKIVFLLSYFFIFGLLIYTIVSILKEE